MLQSARTSSIYAIMDTVQSTILHVIHSLNEGHSLRDLETKASFNKALGVGVGGGGGGW
jgi:dihydroxyacetone kinase-like predicted kinase